MNSTGTPLNTDIHTNIGKMHENEVSQKVPWLDTLATFDAAKSEPGIFCAE